MDRARGAQSSPEYLALNPTGKIPTLITPEGPQAETAACLLWLADRHPEAGLGPPPGASRRGAFLRWLFFLSNTVHADLIRIFYASRFVPPESVDAHHAMMSGHLMAHLDILEAAIRDEPDLFAPPSALALYLGPMLRWAALYPVDAARWLDLDRYPLLKTMLLLLEARASVREAIEAEGLGEAPFTDPKPPTPPEGTAI
ncbi:MAG: glutathione S-transferase family protein [Pseudomonadota bacterium]